MRVIWDISVFFPLHLAQFFSKQAKNAAEKRGEKKKKKKTWQYRNKMLEKVKC